MNDLIPAGPETLPDIARDQHPVWALVDGLAQTIEIEMRIAVMERLPTKQERAQIEEYQKRMRLICRPARESMTERDHAMRAIAAMLGRYPSLRNTDIKGMCTAYLMDLEDFPLFAIIQACTDIRLNRVRGIEKDFPPSTPRVRSVVDNIAAPVRAKVLTAGRVLACRMERRVITPEQREEVQRKMAETLAGLKQKQEDRLLEVNAKVAARTLAANKEFNRREWFYDGRTPPVPLDSDYAISPGLASSNREYAERMKLTKTSKTEGT